MNIKKLIFVLAASSAATCAMANNVQVSNIGVFNRSTVSKTTEIRFNISWENSWRTNTLESNWDAAWVFIKFRKKGETEWKHATLNNAGHGTPPSCVLDTVADRKGVFIKPASTLMPSAVSYQDVGLSWSYGVDGMTDYDSAEVCVFAIEMVYVPEGAFYAGDGNSNSSGSLTGLGSVNNAPYSITSENAITDLAAKDAIGDIPTSTASSSPVIPAAYPKGFKGFYCMKYEITQGQYVAFLNKLTSTQVTPHAVVLSAFRNGISGSWPNYSTSAPHRASNYISSRSGMAYADWAALRPMTELEYEKACRGPIYPVANELAWGDTNAVEAVSSINDGLIDETASNAANANIGLSGLAGALRSGWAGSIPATRANTGCTYYGIAEMTGNMYEITVKLSNTNGRDFTGENGDGSLSIWGDPTVTAWPASSSFQYKGGSSNTVKADCQVSAHPNSSNAQNGNWENGFRCVRTY